jgi:transcriptional regulator with XRE-family HTH domain
MLRKQEIKMLTGPLCRAARALVEISRAQLAARSKVDEAAIERFERKLGSLDRSDNARLTEALEELGAVFIPEDKRGAGVRLKFTASERRRLQTLEDEGGIVRADDVP